MKALPNVLPKSYIYVFPLRKGTLNRLLQTETNEWDTDNFLYELGLIPGHQKHLRERHRRNITCPYNT